MTTRAEHGLPDLPPGRKSDGGPAFPCINWKRAGDVEMGTSFGGATLRDYFAAAALAGAMANPTFWEQIDDGNGKTVVSVSAALLATNSYAAADAMILERSK